MQDTDADWELWGREDPYYGVLAEERFRKGNLDAASLEAFFATGVRQVSDMYEQISRHFGDFHRATGLDFGCGVGRLTQGMAAMCQHVIGLDISPSMLAEAQKGSPPDNTEFVLALSDQTFDWINSLIVFQHIPPARGYLILEDLLARVNDGGAISLHLTLFKDQTFLPHALSAIKSARWDGERLEVMGVDPSPPGAMMMYDYDMTRLIEITSRHGFHTLLSQHTNHGGCHGVILFGRRGM